VIEHVGDCIHEFSLKALPWAESNDAIAFPCHPTINEAVTKWLDAIDQPNVKGKLSNLYFLPFDIPAPANDQLFVVGEYFAENSDDSGSAGERSAPPSDDDLPPPDYSSTPLRTKSEDASSLSSTAEKKDGPKQEVVAVALSGSEDDNDEFTVELKNNQSNHLNEPIQFQGLANLALYQTVLYCGA
jgi:hypothetical protein